MLERRPEEVIRLAVKGMLPRNRLARKQLTKLKVYAGPGAPARRAEAPDRWRSSPDDRREAGRATSPRRPPPRSRSAPRRPPSAERAARRSRRGAALRRGARRRAASPPPSRRASPPPPPRARRRRRGPPRARPRPPRRPTRRSTRRPRASSRRSRAWTSRSTSCARARTPCAARTTTRTATARRRRRRGGARRQPIADAAIDLAAGARYTRDRQAQDGRRARDPQARHRRLHDQRPHARRLLPAPHAAAHDPPAARDRRLRGEHGRRRLDARRRRLGPGRRPAPRHLQRARSRPTRTCAASSSAAAS